jgi:dTDP-4-amino-4,6-dideoxygalactose transaminase
MPEDGLNVCDKIFDRIFSLPIFPALTDQDLGSILEALGCIVSRF